MTSGRHIAAQIVRDIAGALVVLALVFLSYAHRPIDVSHALDHDVLTATVSASFCGGGPADDGRAHAPCHACRIGAGADLPPPCGGVVHLPTATEPAFPEEAAISPVVAAPDKPEARGPPALA